MRAINVGVALGQPASDRIVGEIYWIRVTRIKQGTTLAVTPTIQFDNGAVFPIGGMQGWVARSVVVDSFDPKVPLGGIRAELSSSKSVLDEKFHFVRPWKQIDINVPLASGYISLEYSEDPLEPYPGPVFNPQVPISVFGGNFSQLLPVTPSVGSVYGRVVAPGASGVIASFANPTGKWDIDTYTWYGGTADTEDNMRLRVDTIVLTTLFVDPVINGKPIRQSFRNIGSSGSAPIQIEAIAAGAGGSVYKAMIIATQIN